MSNSSLAEATDEMPATRAATAVAVYSESFITLYASVLGVELRTHDGLTRLVNDAHCGPLPPLGSTPKGTEGNADRLVH